MTDGLLNADIGGYLSAAAMNEPPPPISSDPLVTGSSPIEQLLRILGLAANADDPVDSAESLDEHARRDAVANEAAENFASQDDSAATELSTNQMLPQMVSSIAGALAGAVGGALQPLAQIPQQMAQGVQQALGAGAGLLQQAGGAWGSSREPYRGPLFDDTGSPADDVDLSDTDAEALDGAPDGGDVDGSAGGDSPMAGEFGAAGGPSGTAPAVILGPPPIPSPGTAPTAAPPAPVSPPTGPPAAAAPAGGAAGIPVIPPGAATSGPGADQDAKADTKRVASPVVRNGAAVQGRLNAALPAAPVANLADGRPVATRRVTLPPPSGGS